MEDRMHYMNDPHQNLSIFSIFDGHGGPFVSQYLEENFSNAIRSRLLKSGPDARRLSNAVDAYDTVTQVCVYFPYVNFYPIFFKKKVHKYFLRTLKDYPEFFLFVFLLNQRNLK
ncbi:unnamed protein product [Toxocara canis]|uniref:PPM-type phosphatase domain-containing protein n=1 Tax=Toxocara canis TaxID=6265 RepID=A0A183U7U7_TOXCA|nr:unnamed protein product [Toxocara canis]